jgi:hypothetical protein
MLTFYYFIFTYFFIFDEINYFTVDSYHEETDSDAILSYFDMRNVGGIPLEKNYYFFELTVVFYFISHRVM